jgi:hypothetical protein
VFFVTRPLDDEEFWGLLFCHALYSILALIRSIQA